MTLIEKVRYLEDTMLDEADAQIDDAAATEHIYELYNFISDWEAVWTNSGFDKQ